MAYLPDMEQISSDIRDKVLAAMNAYEPDKYTARDVLAALSHDRCSIEDFKALLSLPQNRFWKNGTARRA